MTENTYLNSIGQNAKTAAKVLSCASTDVKNNALEAMAKALEVNAQAIIEKKCRRP